MVKTLKELNLEDDANKIILNTTGVINDLNDELIEFLKYVEHSDDKTAKESHGTLVKNIHKRVIEIKNNPIVEVEFMTLLERDREKLEEGREEGDLNRSKIAIKNMLEKNMDKETIAELLEIDISLVEKISKEIKNK